MNGKKSNIVTVHETTKDKNYTMSFNHFENVHGSSSWASAQRSFMFLMIILLFVTNIVSNCYIYNYFTKRIAIIEEQNNLFTLRFMTTLKKFENESALELLNDINTLNSEKLRSSSIEGKTFSKKQLENRINVDSILQLFSSFFVCHVFEFWKLFEI